MIRRNSKENLFQFSDKVWLSKPLQLSNSSGTQQITICLEQDENIFVSFGLITLNTDGTFFAGNKSIGKIDEDSFREYIEKITGTNNSQDSSDLFSKVCENYKETKSIKKTARTFEISEEKARRILITEGEYTSEKYEEIKKLLDENKTLPEIAEQLQMSLKQIKKYLPYK